jgi:heavy metal translocating P-type ATPase
LWHLAREYRLFGLALATFVIGLALQLAGQRELSHILLGAVSISEVIVLVWNMWQDIRSGSYGIDILAATAIIASVVLGQYWAAIVIVLMLTGGEALEDFAQNRAKTELRALLDRAPQQAHVIRKGKEFDLSVDELHIGDKILIKPGEIVPVDAVIIEGTASFDESSLTGESLPQTKQTGDQLLSGSVNSDGAVTARVIAAAADSQYQQIIKLVRSAAASQAPFVRLAERYSLPFTISAYSVAIAVWVVSGHAIRFLEVIVVATPCPLLLAAPVALISGMSVASRYGIIVKTGAALERLAQATTFAFDKTGTLTRGELVIGKIRVFGSFDEDDALILAASLEQNSNHVLAQAIVSAAKSQKLKLIKTKQMREISGQGLMAILKGREVLVGRFSLMQEHGIKIPAGFQRASVNQTAVYIATAGQLVGVITFRDELRPEAKRTLAQLRAHGVREMVMITGDNPATAKIIAQKLGINQIHAGMLPADKLKVLSEITDRPTVFVGDGVNDAPILTAADVGIALGARGSTAASESADMVIMLDDLSRVAAAQAIARRTFQIARQSILGGIFLSLILMLIFATGRFSPLTGAIVQEVVDVFVIFNALRAHLIKV